jgi:hypothetical protein
MGAYLTWTTKSGATKVLRFDVVTQETHKIINTITEHPVEKGPDVSDHVRAGLDEITLECFVSNAPIDPSDLTTGLNDRKSRAAEKQQKLDVPEYEAPFSPTPGAVFGAIGGAINSLLSKKRQWAATVLQFDSPQNYVSNTFNTLRQLRDDAQLVQVLTPMWSYEGMVITSVELPRDKESGDGGKFTIALKQIRQIETKQVSSPVPTEKRGEKKKDKGVKGPNEAPRKSKVSLEHYYPNSLVVGVGARY